MNEAVNPEEAEAPGISSGQMLLARRKELGLTIDDISEELHLAPKLIEAMESDQSEGLPESTYVRGYLSNYARIVGLDAEEVLAHYRDPDSQDEDWAKNMPRGLGIGRSGTYSNRMWALVIGLLVIITVVVFAYRYVVGLSDEPEIASGPATPATEASDAEDKAPAAGDTDAEEPSPEPVATTAGASELSTATQQAGVRPAPQDSQTAGQGVGQGAEVELEFEFTNTTWVEVLDTNNRTLMKKSYIQGDVERVSGTPPFRVFVGDAAAVRMRYAGQPFDVMSRRGGSMYARFEVGGGAAAAAAQ